MPPSSPIVRVAVPRPPSTIALPRSLAVFSTVAVLPAATSRMKRVTSARARSATFRVPSSGMMCLLTRLLSR